MPSDIVSGQPRRRTTETYFGDSAPQRVIFVVLISILAWTFAALLVVAIQFARAPYPLPALLYLFVIFHLMPWAVGLRNLRKINKSLHDGMMGEKAANLSYSMILGMLSNTYVVLCCGEVLALAYSLAAHHS